MTSIIDTCAVDKVFTKVQQRVASSSLATASGTRRAPMLSDISGTCTAANQRQAAGALALWRTITARPVVRDYCTVLSSLRGHGPRRRRPTPTIGRQIGFSILPTPLLSSVSRRPGGPTRVEERDHSNDV